MKENNKYGIFVKLVFLQYISKGCEKYFNTYYVEGYGYLEKWKTSLSFKVACNYKQTQTLQ